jgi:Na+/H+-dicarboxylate symporter
MNWKWKESNALTLFALILGGACGLLLYELKSTSAIPLIEFSAAIGKLITNMVRIVVIPLIFTMLVVATSMRSTVALGRVLANSLATFVGLLLVGVSFSVLVAAPLVRRIPAMTLPTDAAGVAAQASRPTGEAKEAPAPTSWAAIGGLLPSNLVRAAANDDFLALVLFAMLLGFATSKLADELRLPLIAFAEASAQILRILTTLGCSPPSAGSLYHCLLYDSDCRVGHDRHRGLLDCTRLLRPHRFYGLSLPYCEDRRWRAVYRFC